jgi:hypothetical protein
MRAEERRKLDMADRAMIFIRAHPPEDAGIAPVIAELEERVGRARRLVKEDGEGRAAERSATNERREVKRVLVDGLLGYLSRVGRAAAKEQPSLAGVFRPLAMRTANRLFVARAESMVAAAREHQELLGRYGLTAGVLDEADRLLGTFVTALEAGATGLLAHVGANAELTVVTAEIMELVSRIDRLHRHRFRDDPDALAAWASARNVQGPFRRRNGTEPEAPSSGVTPEPEPPVGADGDGQSAA